MSRWFRMYDDVVNDPKVQRLSAEMFKAWVNILCIISKTEGVLPPVAEVAFTLRIKVARAEKIINALIECELLDLRDDSSITAHNWNARQYKSDVTDPTAAKRQKAYRDRNANRNATVTVTPTRAETEQTTDTNTVAGATGAVAPLDHRKRLFDEGLPKLAAMTGKGPDACRAFVGKCLKAAGDDAVTVLGLIEDAHRNQVVDPSAWIVARLPNKQPPQGNSNGRRTVHDAANDLLARVHALDEPAPSGLRDGTGEGSVRLLPSR